MDDESSKLTLKVSAFGAQLGELCLDLEASRKFICESSASNCASRPPSVPKPPVRRTFLVIDELVASYMESVGHLDLGDEFRLGRGGCLHSLRQQPFESQRL